MAGKCSTLHIELILYTIILCNQPEMKGFIKIQFDLIILLSILIINTNISYRYVKWNFSF